MRAVPTDLDLGAFVGQQLEQICIGAFNVQFRFERDYCISCEGTVVAETDGNSVQVFSGETGWKDASVLPALVGRTVTGWKVEASHEFSISLSGQGKLRFQGVDGPHEDFVINPGTMVV